MQAKSETSLMPDVADLDDVPFFSGQSIKSNPSLQPPSLLVYFEGIGIMRR
jgi:hypothetical protein